MSNPTIRLRIIAYDGRLWVLHSARLNAQTQVVRLRLINGDETVFAEMPHADYDKLIEAVKPHEFFAATPEPPPEAPVRRVPILRRKG